MSLLLTDNASPGSSDGMLPGFLVEEGRGMEKSVIVAISLNVLTESLDQKQFTVPFVYILLVESLDVIFVKTRSKFLTKIFVFFSLIRSGGTCLDSYTIIFYWDKMLFVVEVVVLSVERLYGAFGKMRACGDAGCGVTTSKMRVKVGASQCRQNSAEALFNERNDQV